MTGTINWHNWDEEALQRAQAQNKPIFLSVGYFSCFWCHVMEHQVYTDPALVKAINDHFVAIKVDREDRPDIDEIYMYARQLITQHSGWPNHAFLTPEGHPFMATGVMLGKPGKKSLAEVAEEIYGRWQDNEAAIRQAAQQIADIVRAEFAPGMAEGDGTPDKTVADAFFHYLQQHYDGELGGFYAEPKFPHESYILFLLAYYRRCNSDEALAIAAQSLKKMAAGGIYDHVGGGFHRYTVDREWRVPHFEKMLYSQALLAQCYTELYEQTGKPYHRDIAVETIEFVLHDLRTAEGAFYSAMDAETGGIEGACYVWQENDIKELFSPKEQELFAKCYGLVEVPPQPGHPDPNGSVIYARQHLMALANEKNRSYESLHAELRPLLDRLHETRRKRKKPDVDNRVITGWNGLMIAALAKAGQILERRDYVEAAVKAANFILKTMQHREGYLIRCWRDGKAYGHAHLRDYAYLESALLSLYDVTGDDQWLEQAKALHRRADSLFWDVQEGGYFVTDGQEKLIVRIHRGHDTGLPSAGGYMLHNLMRLYDITEDEGWLARARMITAVYNAKMKQMPADYATMLQALLYLYR